MAPITTQRKIDNKQLSEEEKQRIANFQKSQSIKKPIKAKAIPTDFWQPIVDLRQHRNNLDVYYEQTPTKDMQMISHARLLEYDIETIKKSMLDEKSF